MGGQVEPAELVTIARAAEDLGYAAVWAGERLMRPLADVSFHGAPPSPVPGPYKYALDPIETLSHIAAVTETIKLGTSVVNALLQPPILLAKRLATLDQFSSGRVIAGLGQGWVPQEFESTGVPMERVGDGLDETVAALRACWAADPVSFDGDFVRIERSEINPKPVQRHLPVLLGSVTAAGARRAARIADGLNPMLFTKDALLGLVKVFLTAVVEAGRDLDSVSVVVRVNMPLTATDLAGDRPFLGGSAAQVAGDLAELEGSGVTQVFLTNEAFTTTADQVRLLGQLIEASTREGVAQR
ncbi:TIGR03619 family F420-dependent LLM class oxidoreductase [Actinoplanes sp. NPDC051470]|uniref:TIGR03619 family F420-dependent LLM class oxidoreductase n=1 Tax=Actinoplanes sp. NPDC051470 TaxID=3157224 RepID=UPI00342A6511